MNGEEKILAILEKMQGDISDLKSGQAKLEQGQAKLEQGQAKLEQGQAKLETDVASLSRRYDVHKVLLEDVQRRATSLQDGQAFIATDVRTVREDVTRIDRTTKEIWSQLTRHDQEIKQLKEI